MTDTRLMEREAENQIDKESIDQKDLDIMVKFNIFNKNKNSNAIIQYKNLTGEWNVLCSLPELLNIRISETMDEYNVTISKNVKSELEKLQKKLSKTWHKRQELYQLSYRKNKDGSSELYIPLDTDHTDDVVIQKVYNENDEFIAENIEDNIEFPLYDLESEELFVESVTESKQDVYRMKDKNFEDFLRGSKKEQQKWIFESGTATIMFYGLLAFLFQYNVLLALVIFGAGTLAHGLSLIIPLMFIAESISYISSYVKYRRSSAQKKFKSFCSESK